MCSNLKRCFFAVYMLLAISVQSQEMPYFLSLDKNLVAEQYTFNGKIISERQVMKLMVMNPDALALVKSSRRTEFLADVVAGFGFSGFLGGVIVLFSGGGLNGLYPTLVGAAIFYGGVVIMERAINKANKAVDLYNMGLSSSSIYERSNFVTLAFKQSALSLTYYF